MTLAPPSDSSASGAEAHSRRSAILREGASTVGAAWVAALCAELANDGRPVEGGWPGTVVEARALVWRHLQVALSAQRLGQPTGEELAAVVAATYESARAAWQTMERRARSAARHRT